MNVKAWAVVGAVAVSGCAYEARTVSTPANNVVTSYSNKIPGKWLLFVEADRLSEVVRPSDMQCAAHNFPLDFRSGFPASARATLPNVLERVEDVQSPVGGDQARSAGAKGVVNIRGESISSRLRIIPGFMSANVTTEVEISAAVTVDGPNGRLFGRTIDGRGKGDTPAGLFCAGGAESLKIAAEQAQRDLLRRIAEEVANSERVRRGS